MIVWAWGVCLTLCGGARDGVVMVRVAGGRWEVQVRLHEVLAARSEGFDCRQRAARSEYGETEGQTARDRQHWTAKVDSSKEDRRGRQQRVGKEWAESG